MSGNVDGMIVGLVLGTVLGIGLTALYLALGERRTEQDAEVWIDAAIERAFEAVEAEPVEERDRLPRN